MYSSLISNERVFLIYAKIYNNIDKVCLKACIFIKDTLKAFDNFKNKQQCMKCMKWYFWYVKVCIFRKNIQCPIHWDKTQMLKKFPSDKVSGTENALFFLSRSTTYHSFTFNLSFLHELKHNGRLSKIMSRIFHFRVRSAFIKFYIFVQQNTWTVWI